MRLIASLIRYAAPSELPPDVRFVTDLRGLTRPAVSLALRAELRLAGEARERGIGACGYGGSWVILTGTLPECV